MSNRIRLSASVSPEFKAAVQEYCKGKEQTESGFIRKLVYAELSRRGYTVKREGSVFVKLSSSCPLVQDLREDRIL